MLFTRKNRAQVWKVFFSRLRSFSVVGLTVHGFSGNWINFTPCSSLSLVEFLLFLLGQLLVRNEFPHTLCSFQRSKIMVGQVGLEPTTALSTGFTVRGDTNYTVLTHMA